MQEEEKEYIIKNHRLLLSLDLTKSTIQDICNYLKYFDCDDKLSEKEQIDRYKELVSILTETVSAYNDDYAIIQDENYIPSCRVEEWELPFLPKEKAEYIANNLSTFIKKYNLLKRANANRKPGKPLIMVGFTKKSLKQFLSDYNEIDNVMHFVPETIKSAYKSIFLKGVSYQEYANQYFDGKKHKSTYIAGQIKEILEQYYTDKEKRIVKQIKDEKTKKQYARYDELYDKAEWEAIEEAASLSESDEEEKQLYEEIIERKHREIDDMLFEEENSQEYAFEIGLARQTKENGRKKYKAMDRDGRVYYVTSEINDVVGDEEFLDNKIFKKDKHYIT